MYGWLDHGGKNMVGQATPCGKGVGSEEDQGTVTMGMMLVWWVLGRIGKDAGRMKRHI